MTPFGTSAEGEAIDCLTLSAGELSIAVLTLGALLQDVRLAGVRHSLTLGSPDAAAYHDRMAYFGALIGPVANRIGGAAATIDDRRHHFEANQAGRHTLHSGSAGSHRKVWTVEESSAAHARLRLEMPAGAGGFPGDRTLHAVWRVTAPATLDLTVEATTTAPTLMNVAHHPFWSLDGGETWDGHRLRVAADNYLPATEATFPTGKVAPVAGTPFDFRAARAPSGSFDNTLCLAGSRRPLTPVARLTGATGISLDIATTEPGLHLYDGRGAAAPEFPGHDDRRYGARAGLALEPQFWPDAPNHPEFPSILMRPGTRWRHRTRYTFSR